jgi:hypothetical protein
MPQTVLVMIKVIAHLKELVVRDDHSFNDAYQRKIISEKILLFLQ